MIPVFDGHNDVLLRLWKHGDRDGSTFLSGEAEGRARGHVDLPRARKGGLAGGFFAIFVPPQAPPRSHREAAERGFAAEPHDHALKVAGEQASILLRLETAGALRIVRSARDIRRARREGVLAAIFHMEGAEAIGPDLAELDLFHAAGLRSLGPVWSRPTIFGHGVPFRFPSSPDTGPGLTEAGRRLVRRCNELRILVDLSHLNEKGFRDVARISDAPLVATHSNAHALCASSRNLADRQLKVIAESRGIVGLNFAVAFLRPDGAHRSDTPLELMVRHLSHLIDMLGEDGVALGSDFDGAMIARDIGDVAGLPNLVEAMLKAGFGRSLVARICHANWENLLARVWGA
ncbi:MAG: membrane dipeptidase [Alphaproteobacteria bacterium]|nr:MAG: membrane dipeptidase [Alphaproteobacteria bacterium]